jgi:hypothetical protein
LQLIAVERHYIQWQDQHRINSLADNFHAGIKGSVNLVGIQLGFASGKFGWIIQPPSAAALGAVFHIRQTAYIRREPITVGLTH